MWAFFNSNKKTLFLIPTEEHNIYPKKKEMVVEWAKNAVYFGQTLLVLLLWVSSWTLIELTAAKYLPKYWQKMVFFGFLFLFTTIIILCFATKFFPII